jgi:hypothetical protein
MGLHQLCAPMLSHAERLPVPQRNALRIAFGLAAGPPPDRFLVGLAVLSLLSEVAAERPLICLVDDEQWLDRASAQTLGFAARRLAADPVGVVFAAREPGPEITGLPELEVGGRREDDARALLEAALAGPLDARVRDLIIAETRGNPLALLELPRGLSPAELAGGFGLPAAAPLTGRIEDSFARQLEALPDRIRRLVQLAAADSSGDGALVWRAAGRLGIGVQAAGPAVDAGLERSAGRAQARGGLAAVAAFLERSVALTADPARHAERILAAATASVQAGAFGKALELLATAEAGPLSEVQSARVDLLRGLIAFATSLGGDAPSLLLKAAKRLEPLDMDLARETYLNAWRAASLAGRLAGAGDMLEVSRAARSLPPPADPPRPST